MKVYAEFNAHLIKGLMIHDQMANYYDFLGLKGYKRIHEYLYFHENKMFRKLNRYYINHHNKLIPEMRVDDPEIIPSSWYNYERENVDASTKRLAVETGFTKWVEWEKETKSMLEKVISDLYSEGYVADCVYLKRCLKEVDKELKCAERMHINLKSTNYDIIYILTEQESLHHKYKCKLKELFE